MFYRNDSRNTLAATMTLALALVASPATAQNPRGEIPPAIGADAPPPGVEVIPSYPTAYCHLKFPAIAERTLGAERPQLSTEPGDVIDYYGPCDHDPLGAEEVEKQMRDRNDFIE